MLYRPLHIFSHYLYKEVSSKVVKLIRIKLGLLLLMGVSGCSSIVTEYLQRSDSFDYGNIASQQEIRALGFEKRQYCSSEKELCISYLSGEALNSEKLKYQIELTSGTDTTEVTLDLKRDRVPDDISGTVVLIHGFRASKEFMLNTALYFRFLGCDVLVPDLLGHGDSEGEKAFGVGDRRVINELITSEYNSKDNLFILGNSMGAVTAVHLSNMRDDVNGTVLQAPMIEFDEAVLRYTRANHPYLGLLFSDASILSGAARALNEAGITVEDTHINPLIISSKSPLLLFASSHDPVSPFEKFSHMNSNVVSVKDLPNRNHPSMGVIGNDDSEVIVDWLKELTRRGGR